MSTDLPAKMAQVRASLEALPDYRFAPLPSPIDHQISDIFSRLGQASNPDRHAFAESVREDDAYALVAYAERMSMLSVRQRSEKLLVFGLAALGYASTKADPRTVLMVVSLLHHSAKALGEDPHKAFKRAYMYLAEPAASELMNGFLRRDPKDQSISVMGFQEIDGPSGIIYWQGTSDSVPDGLK